jgi:hypothetical protein
MIMAMTPSQALSDLALQISLRTAEVSATSATRGQKRGISS